MNDEIDLTREPAGAGPERCCPSHPDWATLTEHLMAAFPQLGLDEVVQAVARAKTSTDGMELHGPAALEAGETLAWLRLQERQEAHVAGGSQASERAARP